MVNATILLLSFLDKYNRLPHGGLLFHASRLDRGKVGGGF
jgi:hypothetical protein